MSEPLPPTNLTPLRTLSAGRRGTRRRGLLVAQITGGTMLLVLAAVVVITGFVQHRSIGRELRSHASYAARTYADLSYAAIQMRAYDLLVEMDGWMRHYGSAPTLEEFDRRLARATAGEDPRQFERVFRVDIDAGAVQMRPFVADSAPFPTADSSAAGTAFADTVFTRGVVAAARKLARSPSMYTVVSIKSERDGPHIVGLVAARPWGGKSKGMYGYVSRVELLGWNILKKTARSAPLLPTSVTTRLPNERLLGIRLIDSLGQTRYRADAKVSSEEASSYPPAQAIVAVPKSPIGAGAVQVTLYPLPASMLPSRQAVVRNALLQLAVLAVTAIVFAFVVRGIRREQELLAMQGNFVTSVSHELRTPLAQIRMYGEMLALDRIQGTAERYHAVDVIVREAKRLGHLVENVLQMTRGTAVPPSHVRPVWVGAVVEETLDGHAEFARAAGVSITADVASGAVVNVDEHALVQMLVNLLDNAIKYAPAGRTVHVVATTEGDSVRIAVDDAGPGIPAAMRAAVLDPFVRLGRDAKAGTTGSGIGLAVVSRLAALYGGAVEIADSPLGGARVALRFPRAQVAPERADALEATPVA